MLYILDNHELEKTLWAVVDTEDDGKPFTKKVERLTTLLCAQMAESERLNAEIRRNLESPDY
ncbi:MAG: hypothetical protein JXA78_00080 [Anaerolineales bacterium]|nr:hypothetical protein [Anaerolineales bacterium]